MLKIQRRSGISQSIDLFIIIAAVIAAGGLVTATLLGLIGSSASNTEVGISSVQLSGSTVVTTLGAFSITIKNTGTTTISCTTSTCQIQFAGTSTGTSPAPTFTGFVATAGGTWTATTAASAAEILSPGTAFTLTPGGQISMSFSSLLMGSAATGSPASGSSITIVLPNWGSANTQVKTIAA